MSPNPHSIRDMEGPHPILQRREVSPGELKEHAQGLMAVRRSRT